MKAWLFQDHRQKQKLGEKAPWSVGWIDPDGKRCSKRLGAKSVAEKFARKTEGQLAGGVYQSSSSKTWAQFVAEFDKVMAGRMKPGSMACSTISLGHFERIIHPKRVSSIKTKTIDAYVSARRLEGRCKHQETEQVASSTINKELRFLRAALRKAVKWGFLPVMPEIVFLRERRKIPTFVAPEAFAKLYGACERACEPEYICAADWWRAFLVTAYMTGWRVGSILSLRWADVDLDEGTALSRADDNKGGRDQRIDLHPLIIEHLRKIESFRPCVFDWGRSRHQLYRRWHALQRAAGVKRDDGRLYGFHDLRRAFATLNADRMTADALQLLMQHRDYETTQKYINMARQAKKVSHDLFVPTLTLSAG